MSVEIKTLPGAIDYIVYKKDGQPDLVELVTVLNQLGENAKLSIGRIKRDPVLVPHYRCMHGRKVSQVLHFLPSKWFYSWLFFHFQDNERLEEFRQKVDRVINPETKAVVHA